MGVFQVTLVLLLIMRSQPAYFLNCMNCFKLRKANMLDNWSKQCTLEVWVMANKMQQGENHRDFLKWGNRGLFLGHSLIIIKWTWGFFPPKFAILRLPPSSPYNYTQKGTKKRCGICWKSTIKTSERHQCLLMFSCQNCESQLDLIFYFFRIPPWFIHAYL